jgi:hypothetical protein
MHCDGKLIESSLHLYVGLMVVARRGHGDDPALRGEDVVAQVQKIIDRVVRHLFCLAVRNIRWQGVQVACVQPSTELGDSVLNGPALLRRVPAGRQRLARYDYTADPSTLLLGG